MRNTNTVITGTTNTVLNQKFDAFLTMFTINLSHAYPATLGTIDYQAFKRIAQYSLECSNVAIATWLENNRSGRGVGAVATTVTPKKRPGRPKANVVQARPRMLKTAQAA